MDTKDEAEILEIISKGLRAFDERLVIACKKGDKAIDFVNDSSNRLAVVEANLMIVIIEQKDAKKRWWTAALALIAVLGAVSATMATIIYNNVQKDIDKYEEIQWQTKREI